MANISKFMSKDIGDLGKLVGINKGSLSKVMGLNVVSYYTGIDKWDDGTYRYIGGTLSYDAQHSFIRMGVTGTNAYAESWSRFVGVTVPQGATIDSAFVRYSFNYTDGDTYMIIKFVDSDDAPRIGSLVDWQGTSWTTASVVWDLNTGGLSIGDEVDTPDIASVVQEVVDRAGWSSGNAMAIRLQLKSYNLGDEVRFNAYDQTTYAWSELHIEYS
jgi:hypothetical protein